MSILLEQKKSAAPLPARKERAAWDGLTALLLGFAAVCLLVISHAALGHWWSEYRLPETYYGHAPAIPLLVALMLWHRRSALGAVLKSPCYGALGLLLPSLGLLLLATKEDMPAVEGLGFLLSLWSSVWLVLGTRFVRVAAFPLLFIMGMAPLPGPLLNDATFGIQQLSTQGAVWMLHLLGFGPSLSGNIITLPNYTVFVDMPCSGFKLLLSLLTCSAALAYLLDGSRGRRLSLFAFSLPLSVAINIARLTLLCIVGDCFGATAGHIFHDWDGLLTLMAGVLLLFAVAKRLGCHTFAGWPLF